MTLYETFRQVCANHGTTVSTVLREIGRPTGSITGWKKGAYPNLETVIQMADHMGITIMELVYGEEYAPAKLELTDQEAELLDIFDRIPEERRQMCIDFLRTHVSVPEKKAEGKRA